MKQLLFLTAVALLFLAVTDAQAGTFNLNFGGLQSSEQVLSYYDGGFGSLGSGPGPDYGITFDPNFDVIMAVPPYGPDRVGELTGTSAIMNVEGGFTNVLSFYYQAPDNSGVITIWSGPDGTGSMLASFSLTPASVWSPAGTSFPGTAMSVVFSGTPGTTFDVITSAGFVLPEPSSYILFVTGIGGMYGAIRHRHKSICRC